jgi:hypothetical protein
MEKISDDKLMDLADSVSKGGEPSPSHYYFFGEGYRIAETKHLKTIKKLQTLIKQHRVIIDALCNEEKK